MRISAIEGLRDEWYAIEVVASQPEPRLVPIQLFGERYVLFVPTSGEAALFSPFCPHRGAGLHAAAVLGETIRCAYHGWEFDHTGACTRVPQLEAELPVPSRARVKTFPVVERYGLYWTCIGSPSTDGPPHWHEADDLGWRVNVDFFEPWSACALRIIDNNIDQSHPAFVHQGTFGNPDRPEVPPYELEETKGGFKAKISHEVAGVGPQMGIVDEAQRFERITEVELLSPVQTRILLAYDGRAHDYCFYGSATPLDDDHAMYVRVSALAADEDAQPYEMFWDFSRRVTNEDRVVLETTDPDFPLEVQREVHVGCDRTTVEYRRVLGRLTTRRADQISNR